MRKVNKMQSIGRLWIKIVSAVSIKTE